MPLETTGGALDQCDRRLAQKRTSSIPDFSNDDPNVAEVHTVSKERQQDVLIVTRTRQGTLSYATRSQTALIDTSKCTPSLRGKHKGKTQDQVLP